MAFSRLLVQLAGQSRVIPHRHLTRSVLRVDRYFPSREGLIRTVATIPSKPPHGGDGDRSSRSKKLFAALSSALVGAGLVVGYKLFNDDLRLEWNKAECAENSADPCSECGESCIHKLDKEEENITKANADLEKALKDIKPKAQQATEDAMKAELESLFSSDDCISTFTENESAMILTHAYKKVLRIQKELAQVQVNDIGILDASQLNSNVEDTIPESEKNIQQGPTEADMELMKATFVQKLEEVRKNYESELTKNLIRQAQVLQEVFERAKTAVQEEYERRLKHRDDLAEAESLVELRDKYNKASAALAAMEVALKDRHMDDGKAEKYKKLWAVSNSLYNRINFAGHVTEDVQNDIVCVNKKSLLKEFADDEFVTSLLKNIPDNVSSAESLRERFFNKVDNCCRKVAVFKNDDSLSLWKYLLGTLQASLTIKCEGEHEDDGTVYSLLDRTGYFLKHGDLLEAAAVLNKIEGAIPRRICQDWLNDARSHLETKQTLFALMTYASANSFR